MRKYLILLIALFLSSVNSTFANDEDLEAYISQCNAPAALYDPEAMASTLAEPSKFIQLLETLFAPSTTMTMYECIANEEQFETVLNTMSDPEKLAASMSTFMSPQVYLNWMKALQDPATQQALLTYMKPEHYMQWLNSIHALAIQQHSLKNY